MLLTNHPKKDQNSFSDFIDRSLINVSHVRIASGYVGEKIFLAHIDTFKKILQEGGCVQLLFGISFWEGVTSKTEHAMREFHNFAASFANNSGVFFCVERHYHGKLYIFDYTNPKLESLATVGSSNFSPTGFGNWSELNIVIKDKIQVADLKDFFSALLQAGIRSISDIPRFGESKKRRLTLRQKDREQKVMKAKWPIGSVSDSEAAEKLDIAFRLPLRLNKDTEQSSLNVFNGAGRKSNNKTTRRGWYEVENTIKKGDPCRSDLNKYLPRDKGPYRFDVITNCNEKFEANFNRKTGDKQDQSPLTETGVDFQTARRRVLGYFIKDRLVKAGLVKEEDVITQDVLDEYGCSEIIFRYLGKDSDQKDQFYMTFPSEKYKDNISI